MLINLTVAAMLVVLAASGCMAAAADLTLDVQRSALSLNGRWQLLVEQGEKEVWQPEVAAGLPGWQEVEVPSGSLVPIPAGPEGKAVRDAQATTQFVWVRRSFELTDAQARGGVVLRWGGIRFGARAYVNGQQVADHVPVGPHTVLLPAGLLRPGVNHIVLRVPGWAGMPRSKSGFPLTPTGGATQSWGGKGTAIYQDVWLEFYDRAYARWVLAMPDVVCNAVTFRIWLDSIGELPAGVRAVVTVGQPGEAAVLARVEADVPGGREPFDVTVELRDPTLWTPQTPHLYKATVTLTADGKACDAPSFTFGMREIAVQNGHFALNGRRLWLRGSNLVNEWLWGPQYNQNIKAYLVDEARAMNLNSFRTHTQPPPAAWLDVADRHGMMILAETPLLYNHGDFGYTAEEYEILHRNALTDANGWITRMWNHPSVILWVLSNESHLDSAWESGPYHREVKALDPTRPTMRTGEELMGTPDTLDVHTCFNVVRGAEGQLIVDMTDLMARKDPTRPLSNTEYMNHMWDPSMRWLGRDKHPEMPLAYAECAAEHTEAMRRLQFDCLLPYMYAGWTGIRTREKWRPDYPTPMAAALHSAMAPVLASLELFDRNYATGTAMEVPVTLLNELHQAVPARLDVYLTPVNPYIVPDADALKAHVWHQTRDLNLPPDSKSRMSLRVPVPDKEGTWYLAAVVTREGARPVVSQRVVRSINPAPVLEQLKGHRVALFGGTAEVRAFLRRSGCAVSETVREGRIAADVAVIDDVSRISDITRPGALRLLDEYARSGGRIVVLSQASWPQAFRVLADVNIGLPEFKAMNPVICSRAHRYAGADHPALAGITSDWLWRWNGLPGEIANETILPDSPALQTARKLLWAARDVHPTLISLPVGRGDVLVCQLRIRPRLDETQGDPAAQRLLANLLSPPE